MESFDMDFGQLLDETLVASERVSNFRQGVGDSGKQAGQFEAQDFFSPENLQHWINSTQIKSDEAQPTQLECEEFWRPDIEAKEQPSKLFESELQEDSDFSEHQWLPKAPGLIYLIEKGRNTFCIRGIPVADIEDSLIKIRTRPELLAQWRGALFNQQSQDNFDMLANELVYFQTPSLELAETLQDNLINRRFPYEEDVLCNVSDPGFSWWLDERGDEFSIYFKSYGINRAQLQMRLGPIGDAKISSARFMGMQEIFRSIFPVKDYSINDREMRIASSATASPRYAELKELFMTGKFIWGLQDFPNGRQGRTLFYFFQELACARRFWLAVEENLDL